MKVHIVCQDKHEASKLASLIYIKDGKETFISAILNVFDNEIVIALKDKSAHSIVLKDNHQTEVFADFIQAVLEQKNKIIGTKATDDTVEIERD